MGKARKAIIAEPIEKTELGGFRLLTKKGGERQELQ